MASERKMPRTKSERQFRSRTQSITSNDSEQGGQSGNNPKVKPSSSGSSLYKTELCRSFEEAGICRYGKKCQFAHSRKELRHLTRHPKYKTDMCKSYHTSGFCPYGTRCHFLHEVKVEEPENDDKIARNVKISDSIEWPSKPVKKGMIKSQTFTSFNSVGSVRSVPSIPSMESIWSTANTTQPDSYESSSIWNDSERTNWLTFSSSPDPYRDVNDLKIDVLKIIEDAADDDYNRLSVFRKINST